MTDFGIHYIYSGLAVLIGSIAFMKLFDFLANQSAKRLLDAASQQ
jgi:hypothetical protein